MLSDFCPGVGTSLQSRQDPFLRPWRAEPGQIGPLPALLSPGLLRRGRSRLCPRVPECRLQIVERVVR